MKEIYLKTRNFTEKLCSPLAKEDYVVQTMPDMSPAKWHLAHTTWFFETLLLKLYEKDYKEFHPQFHYLFNSYYNGLGSQHPRSQRGYLSRPTVETIFEYRKRVDAAMVALLKSEKENRDFLFLVELGLNHEQQHQELILTDLKHLFSCNPLHPVYADSTAVSDAPKELVFQSFDEGIIQIGHDGNGFGYDNEFPSHQKYIHGFKLASRLITNGEYLAFIEDGGYQKHEFWFSDGWSLVQQKNWKAPLYWYEEEEEWRNFTLNGAKKIDLHAPVCHVSYYEADAYARWAGKRLPSEEEWEVAARRAPIQGNFVENQNYSPIGLAHQNDEINQMYGDVWEWTQSPYVGYPGFKPSKGSVGEYNGKFMSNQMVLRGGSCATSKSHIRSTYRNFFYPHQQWQFSGIRLAQD